MVLSSARLSTSSPAPIGSSGLLADLPDAGLAEVEEHTVGAAELQLALDVDGRVEAERFVDVVTRDRARRDHLVGSVTHVVDLEADVMEARERRAEFDTRGLVGLELEDREVDGAVAQDVA